MAMLKKRETARQRLIRQAIKNDKFGMQVANSLRSFLDEPETRPADWTDKKLRQHVADTALTISEQRDADAPTKKAFATFNLDPANPFDWRRLLNSLVLVLF